jgi:predicted nucleic acid-binding Zn ribbon protein
MKKRRRGNIAGGLLLILLGILFIIWQVYPDSITNILGGEPTWPLIIIGVGLVFLFVSFVTQVGGFAIPGCIIGGIGLMLYYQNASGDWTSWAYGWMLIPGFTGLGLFIASFLDEEQRRERRTGLNMFITFSLIVAVLWAVFHTDIVSMEIFWPALIILLGLYILVRGFFRRR